MVNTSWLQSIRLCLALLCVVGISGVGSVAASQLDNVWTGLGEDFSATSTETDENQLVGNTYVLPASGAEVVLADGLVPETSDFEDQIVVNSTQGMGAVAVIQGLGLPETVLETYASAFGGSLDGAEQIHIEGDREFASGLYLVDLLGVSVFMYITVDAVSFPGYLTIQVALAESDIGGAIQHFRENVAINGQPMFAGIDESEVQEMVDQNLGS